KIEEESRELYELRKARYEPFVGKTFWVTGQVELCPEPTFMPACTTIRAPRRLVVNRVVRGFQRWLDVTHTDSDPYCHVTTNDGLMGYAQCAVIMAQSMDVDPVVAAAECKQQGGKPRIGASAKLLEACWGKPLTTKRKETTSGVTDKYIYDGGR